MLSFRKTLDTVEQFFFSHIFLIEDSFTHLGINEAIRFQLKTDPRGLVGFVREISSAGARWKIGKVTDAPENESARFGRDRNSALSKSWLDINFCAH